MRITTLFTGKRAVSPVIGVILMVAITVILAAVIGAFVLGLGTQVSTSPPQVSLEFTYTASDTGGMNVTIVHGGGSVLDAGAIKIIGIADPTEIESADSFQTGEMLLDDKQASGDRVRVIWTAPSGGSSNIIGSSTVPS